jgi:endoglucanase
MAWGGIEYRGGYECAARWSHLLDIVRWGTDWIMKAHASQRVF